MKNRRGLGSGLGALLPDEPRGGVREIAIDQIRQNPRQPRTYFDEDALADLVASIREHGIIQPLIVSARDASFELIAGERRWRAAQRAGLTHVPVVVRETTDQQLLELALIENVQRADLNPIEEARAYQNLVDDFGFNDSQIALRVGKNNRVTIANTRRLLKLPQPAQDAVLRQSISAGHGRALLKLDAEDQQLIGLQAIIDDELSVREAEELGDLAKQYAGDVAHALATIRRKRASRVGSGRVKAADAQAAQPAKPSATPDDQDVARALQRVLGTPVAMQRSSKDLRVTITFYDDEKLQEFYDLLASAQAAS